MIRKILTTAALGLCLTGMAWAGDDDDAKKKMVVGDKAPPIDIAHWIKGVEIERGKKFTPMTDFEEGKVYVLEFWATWCGPCKAGMPHISELQAKYKDYGVTVIGISDEPLATVIPFLFTTWKQDGKVQNDRIGYTLCTDPDESVKKDYFRAAGRTGIPCAFIIGKSGHVEWIGHPMQMDKPLEAIVHDTWNRDEYAAQAKREAAAKKKLQTASQNEDWETVVGIYDDMLAEDPTNQGMLMQKFNLLLMQMNKPEKAYEVGAVLAEVVWNEAPALNQIAWTVVDNEMVKTRDLDFALRVAKRANKLTDSKDPAILDTLARVHYEQGDLKKAIKFQKMAAENAGEGAMADDIRKTLKKYESVR